MPGAESVYLFRHALLRDAAYGLQPPGERAGLHSLALDIFEQLYPQRIDEFAIELADHAHAAADAPASGRKTTRTFTRRELGYLARAADAAERDFRTGDCLQVAARILAHPAAKRAEQAKALLLRGTTLLRIGKPAEAEQALLQAQQTARETDPKTEMDSLTQLGNLMRSTARLERAAECFRAALDLARAKQLEIVATVTSGLATVAALTGNAEEAERLYEQSLAAPQQPIQRARVLYNRATSRQGAGRWHDASRDLHDALELARHEGNRDFEGIVRSGLAISLKMAGRIAQARQEYVLAIELLKSCGNLRHVGIARGNLGELLSEAGEHDAAEPELQAALAIHRETGDVRFEATVLTSLGNLAAVRADNPAARELYSLAILRHGDAGNHRGLGNALNNLASTEQEEGNLDLALDLSQRAIASLERAGDRVHLAVAHGARAQLLCFLGRHPEARTLAAEAEAVLAAAHVPGLLVEFGLQPLFQAELAAGNRAAAEAVYERLRAAVSEHPQARLEWFAQSAAAALKAAPARLIHGRLIDELPQALKAALAPEHGKDQSRSAE